MFFPYRVDVPMARLPWMNWLLIAGTIAISIALFSPLSDWDAAAQGARLLAAPHAPIALPAPDGLLRFFMLFPCHFHPAQLIGHLFTHADIGHLLGNMWFLWIFGNAVNAKLGQWQFLTLYLGVGITEGLIWILTGQPLPAIGASGAIMGIVGAFLIFYPLNDISCLLTWSWTFQSIQFSSAWLIALYVAYDIWGLTTRHDSGVGYLAHVVGFASGALVAALLLHRRLLPADRSERSLLQVCRLLPDNPDETHAATAWQGAQAGTSTQRPAWVEAAAIRKNLPPRTRDNTPIPLD